MLSYFLKSRDIYLYIYIIYNIYILYINIYIYIYIRCFVHFSREPSTKSVAKGPRNRVFALASYFQVVRVLVSLADVNVRM